MRISALFFHGILTFTYLLLAGCSAPQEDFTVINSSTIDRTDEPIVLTRQDISEKVGNAQISEGKLPLPSKDGEPVPAQIDDINRDGEWDELAFTLNIAAGDTQQISIEFILPEDYPEFEERTNVRFGILAEGEVNPVKTLDIPGEELPVPLFTRYQMDGPAWENDKVGFRQYIDGRNGRDLYGKTMASMALDTVGIADDGTLEDDYHVMLPWGRDILAVGNSLGLGGLAMLENDEPVRLGVRMDAEQNNVDTTSYKLITEGPVRSIFKLDYKGWDTGNNTYSLENTVTIWAGRYGYTNEVSLISPNNSDTLIVGIVNIHNDNPPTLLEDTGTDYSAFYTHDKQTYDDEWYLGMGIIFPSEPFISYQEAPEEGPGITTSYLNLFELFEDKKLTYHVLAGWELSNEQFADAEYFDAFMMEEIRKVSTPVTVE